MTFDFSGIQWEDEPQAPPVPAATGIPTPSAAGRIQWEPVAPPATARQSFDFSNIQWEDEKPAPRQKGPGFLGTLKRPDGYESTELSIGVNMDGKEVEIPSLVPTLTKKEIDYLLAGNEVTDEIVSKAVEHARMRMAQGENPFKEGAYAPQMQREAGIPAPKQKQSRSIGGLAKDTAIGLGVGTVNLGQSVVGLADILSGNLAGRGLEAIGYDPDKTIEILESFYTDPMKEARAKVQDAEGFWNTVKAMVENPKAGFGVIVESAPLMLGSSAVARSVATKMLGSALASNGIKAGTKAAQEFAKKFFASPAVQGKIIAAGSAAEGLTVGGMMQETQREAGKGWGESLVPSLGAAATTAGIGILSSKIPGMRDAEAMFGTAGYGERKGLLGAGKEIAKTIFKEGVLEELPQEMTETIWENLALGRPWNEGVGKAGAMGMVAGMGQGGGMAIASTLMDRKGKPVGLDQVDETKDTDKPKPTGNIIEDYNAGIIGSEEVKALYDRLPEGHPLKAQAEQILHGVMPEEMPIDLVDMVSPATAIVPYSPPQGEVGSRVYDQVDASGQKYRDLTPGGLVEGNEVVVNGRIYPRQITGSSPAPMLPPPMPDWRYGTGQIVTPYPGQQALPEPPRALPMPEPGLLPPPPTDFGPEGPIQWGPSIPPVDQFQPLAAGIPSAPQAAAGLRGQLSEEERYSPWRQEQGRAEQSAQAFQSQEQRVLREITAGISQAVGDPQPYIDEAMDFGRRYGMDPQKINQAVIDGMSAREEGYAPPVRSDEGPVLQREGTPVGIPAPPGEPVEGAKGPAIRQRPGEGGQDIQLAEPGQPGRPATLDELLAEIEKPEIGQDDRINGVTRQTAGDMIAKGDRAVLDHIREGIKIHGRYPMMDAINNEVNRRLNRPMSFAERGKIQSLYRDIKKVLAGEDVAQAKKEIDQAAQEADTKPSEAKKEAGNYKKGHITWNALDISIENPKGSTRSGVDEGGQRWKSKLKHHYGYIRRTEGADGDQVDIFMGPRPDSDRVFVVNQVNPKTKAFDEHKVMLGFPTEKQARVGYLANYMKGWKGLGSIQEMSVDEFKAWLKEGDQKVEAEEPGGEEGEVTLYRGSSKEGGEWYTPDEEAAKEYSRLDEGGKVVARKVNLGKLNLAGPSDIMAAAEAAGVNTENESLYSLVSVEFDEVVDVLKSQGFDGVRLPEGEDFAPSGKAIESFRLFEKAKKPKTPAPKEEGEVKEPWEMTEEEYTASIGATQPKIELFSDVSPSQATSMSGREISRRAKDRQAEKSKQRKAYDEALKAWNDAVLGAYEEGKFSLPDVYEKFADKGQGNAFYVIRDTIEASGMPVESPFKISQRSNESRREYLQKIESQYKTQAAKKAEPKASIPFSQVAQAAADNADPWMKGADKVFISDAYAQATGYTGTLEDFKNDLVAAHRKGEVELSRADMVEAMDPAKVKASRAEYLNAEFHFIKRGKGAKAPAKFSTYQEAADWIEAKAKDYPSKNAFYASQEYKDAYPEISRLRSEYDATQTDAAKKAMKEVGVAVGDAVEYVALDAMPGQVVSGKVFMKNGLPWVRLDEQAGGRKELRWHKGWSKTSKAPATDKESLTGEAGTDRDSFTLDRAEGPETYKRGEYVKAYLSEGKYAEGTIEGISNAKKEFKLGNVWYKFGRAYKTEKPPARPPKDKPKPLSEVVESVNRKMAPEGGFTEADRVEPKSKEIEFDPLKMLTDPDYSEKITTDETLKKAKAEYDKAKSEKAPIEARISELRRVNENLEREIEDWKNREYKQNRTKYEKKDEFGQFSGMSTISAANERRRKRNIQGRLDSIQDNNKRIERLEGDLRSVEAYFKDADREYRRVKGIIDYKKGIKSKESDDYIKEKERLDAGFKAFADAAKKSTPAPKPAAEPGKATHRAYIDGKWRPIIAQRDITRGKQKGKVMVTLPDGTRKRVERDAIRVIEGEKQEAIPGTEPKPKPPKPKKPPVKPRTIRQWIVLRGGVNPNDPTWKGEFDDIRWQLQGGRKVAAPGFSPGFWNNSAPSLDERAAQAVEEGWLPEGSTDQDLYDAIINDILSPDAREELDLAGEQEYYRKLAEEYADKKAEVPDEENAEELADRLERETDRDAQAEAEDRLAEVEREAIEAESLIDVDTVLDDFDTFFAEQPAFELTPTEPTPQEQAEWDRQQGMTKRPEKGERPRARFPDEAIRTGTTGKQESLLPKEQKKGETGGLFDEPQFSRRPPDQQPPSAPVRATRLSRSITRVMGQFPGIKGFVQVVQSEADLPADAKAEIKRPRDFIIDGKSLSANKEYQGLTDKQRANVNRALGEVSSKKRSKEELAKEAKKNGGDYQVAYDFIKDSTSITHATMEGQFNGMHFGGKVYIVADNLSSLRAGRLEFLTRLVEHEGRHWAFGQIFPSVEAKNRFLKRVDRAYQKEVSEWLSRFEVSDTPENRTMAAEEVLVSMTRRGATGRLIDHFVAKIMEWARKVFPGLNLTKAEARNMVEAAEAMMRGEEEAVQGFGINEFAQDVQFSLKEAVKKITDNPNFVKWFGKSKVVNENGEPLVVYHGTGRKFYQFAKDKIGSFTGNMGHYGKGFYFSGTKSDAKNYGHNIVSAYLSIKNPFIVDENTSIKTIEKLTGFKGEHSFKYPADALANLVDGVEEEFSQNLMDLGFDGVIVKTSKGEVEYVAFSPTQIKSIYNQGTFDPANPDIRFQLAFHGTPHIFPPEPGFPHGRPRLDKIFSKETVGEGGWAYGAGFYMGEEEDLAKTYKETLSANRNLNIPRSRIIGSAISKAEMNAVKKAQKAFDLALDIHGVERGNRPFFGDAISFYNLRNKIDQWDEQHYEKHKKEIDEQINGWRKGIISKHPDWDETKIAQALTYFGADGLRNPYSKAFQDASAAIGEEAGGSLYTLDIPDDVMPQLLDWDKPVPVGQLNRIKLQAAKEWSNDLQDTFNLRLGNNDIANKGKGFTGQNIYHAIANTLGNGVRHADIAASEFLARAGIPGNTHGGISRGATGAKYVIWDQKVLDRIALLKRNGEKLDAMREAQRAQYMFAGPKAQGVSNLANAKRMQAEGASRGKIWNDTGWWEIVPGQWSFEIDDSKSKWSQSLLSRLKEKYDYYATNRDEPYRNVAVLKVGDVLKHPELFKHYPDIKNISIFINPDKPSGTAEYIHETDEIVMSNFMEVPEDGSWANEAKSLLAHEIQHAIQEREGFARGGSPEAMRGVGARKIHEIDPALSWAYGEFYPTHRRLYPNVSEYDKKLGETWAKDFSKPDIERMVQEAIANEQRETGETGYKSLTGEAESRLVQKRLDMTPAQRKAEPPWVTLDKMLREEGLLKEGQTAADVLISRGTATGPQFMTKTALEQVISLPAFEQWFQQSAIQHQGDPVIMYRGRVKPGIGSGRGKAALLGEGHYFTASPEYAGMYPEGQRGANIAPVFLSVQNPLIWDQSKPLSRQSKDVQEWHALPKGGARSEFAKSRGYDGVVWRRKGSGPESLFNEVVVFDKGQAKSVFNAGTFDRARDIQFMRKAPTRGDNLAAWADQYISDAMKDPGSEKAKRVQAEKEYFEGEGYRKDAADTAREVVESVKKAGENGWQKERPDTSVLSRWLQSAEFYFQKVPAAWRVFQASLDRTDDYHQNYNDLTADEKRVTAMKQLKKQRPKEYEKLRAVLVHADMNQIKHTPESLKKKGFSDQAINAWQAFRDNMSDGFDRLYAEMDEMIKDRERNGLELPKVVTWVGGEKIEVDLKVALAQMGEMKGWYFPRIRKPGRYMLTAKKKGENPVLEFYDTKIGANRRSAELSRNGYTVSKQKSKDMPEDVFQLAGQSIGMQAMFNQALERVGGQKATLESFGLQAVDRVVDQAMMENVTEATVGSRRIKPGLRDFMVVGPTPKWMTKVLRDVMGGKYYSAYAGEPKAWHFYNPGGNFESRLAKALAANNPLGQTVDQKTTELFAYQLATMLSDIVKERGYRSGMVKRAKLTGKDVWVGYETDPLNAMAKYTMGLSAGLAKRDMALKMVRAVTGTDISWNDFKLLQSFRGSFEEFQGAYDIPAIDREAFEQWNKPDALEDQEAHLRDLKDNLRELRGQGATGEEIDNLRDEIAGGQGWRYQQYQELVKARRIDPEKQKNIFHDTRAYMEEMLRNQEFADRVIGVVKGLTVLKYLGFRLASPLVNLTALVTTVPASMNAYAGVSLHRIPGAIVKGLDLYSRYRWGDKSKLDPDVVELFDTIHEKGWANAQYNMEALAVLRSKLGGGYERLMNASMYFFGMTESLNRVATIAGGYVGQKDEAKRQGREFDPAEAVKKAKHASDRSHGTYGKTTLPYLAQGSNPFAQMGRCFYVFSKFSHTYLQNMYEIGFEQKNAKALTYMMLSPAILAGGGAIPVLWPTIMLALSKMLDVDEPEERLYAWLTENVGDLWGELARTGVVGLGGEGINMKGSLGLDPIGGFPTTIPELLGAPADAMIDLYYGGRDILKGRFYRGIETMAPMAIGRGMAAYRESKEGVTTHAGTPKLLDGQRMEPTMWDTLLQMTTFNPAHMAAMKEKKWSQAKLTGKYRAMKSDIYAKLRDYYNQPTEERSPEAMADIMADIETYNNRVIERGLVEVDGISVITRQGIQTALRATR